MLEQDFTDFELLISDDEVPGGESWSYLEELARTDSRIRIIQNRDGQGQASNVNHLFAHVRGSWIKPLWDDDRLRPGCLSQFARAARACPTAALICCYSAEFNKDKMVSEPKPPESPWAFSHSSEDALSAAYRQEGLGGGGLPTAVMAKTSLVQDGVIFETPEGITTLVDSWWFTRLIARGRRACINRVLVDVFQGEIESVTSQVTDLELDAQYKQLRRLMVPMLPKDRTHPSLTSVLQMLNLIRACVRLRDRRPLQGIRLAITCWHPKAWWLAWRWLARGLGLSVVKPLYPATPVVETEQSAA